MTSLVRIEKIFQLLAANHRQIASYGYLQETKTDNTVEYPQMYVKPEPGSISGTNLSLKYSLYFSDLVHKDASNVNEVLSDMLQIAMDVLAQLKLIDFQDYFTLDQGNVSLTPFTDSEGDDTAGYLMALSLNVNMLYDQCAVPSDLSSSGDLLEIPQFGTITPTQWHDGSGVPSNSLGNNGDYYLDDETGDIYRKDTGAYIKVANIRGPAISAGAGLSYSNGQINIAPGYHLPTDTEYGALATQTFVSNSIAALLNGAPAQLDTLKELADALADDANFAATVTSQIASNLTAAKAYTDASIVAINQQLQAANIFLYSLKRFG